MQVTHQRILRAVEYVEDHLFDELSLSEVAKASGMSLHHLHRMFRAATGESLKSYVRKRRLTAAMESLRSTMRPIIQIAFESGFLSQEAFTRAFQGYVGTTPGTYRRAQNQRHPGLSRLTISAVRHRHEGITLEPRIESRDSISLRGWGVASDFEDDIPILSLWDRVIGALEEAGADSPVLHGVAQAEHHSLRTDASRPVAYFAAVQSGRCPKGIPDAVEIRVPAGKYAVFEHIGSLDHIVETVNYAWATWLPQSPWHKSSRPDLEVVPWSSLASASPRMEYWLSIGSEDKR